VRFSTWLSQLVLGNRFLHFGFLLTALHISGGVLGYIYQIVMGRVLHPVEFALFSSIMAVYMFFSAPAGAMSMLIVRKVSSLKAHQSLNLFRSLFFHINKLLLIFGAVVFIFFWLGSPYLQRYLKVEGLTPIALFALILVFSFFTTACMAFMQGMQRFILLGIFGLLGVLGKLLIGVGLVNLGFGFEGALLGVLLAMVLIYITAIPMLFKSLPPQIAHQSPHISIPFLKSALPVLIANTAFAAMTQLDMALVNWYFSPNEAGLYAAASVLGKAVLYLPGGLILALFPMVSENHAKGENSFKLFQQAVFVTIMACGTIAGVYWFFADLIISIVYGESYKGAGSILRWYGLAILPLTIVVIAEQYLIAKGQVLFAWIFLLMLPVELLAIYIWHTEIWMVLIIMSFFGFLLALIGYSFMWRMGKLNIVK
jgi:O-antigen/teichoic acid export membrane protein